MGRVSYTTNEFAFFGSILQATLKTKLFPGCFPNATKFVLITISGAPRIVNTILKRMSPGYRSYTVYT